MGVHPEVEEVLSVLLVAQVQLREVCPAELEQVVFLEEQQLEAFLQVQR